MTLPSTQLEVLIGRAGTSDWADRLAQTLSAHPVDFHWSADVDAAVGFAVARVPHLAIVEESLPQAGGLDALRRMRRSGLTMPCLLVAEAPDRRLMIDAMQLNVFSVVTIDLNRDLLTPVVIRLLRQVYQLDWPDPQNVN